MIDLGSEFITTWVGYPMGTLITDSPQPARYIRLLGFPSGLAVDPARSTAFVAEFTGHQIIEINFQTEPITVRNLIGVGG